MKKLPRLCRISTAAAAAMIMTLSTMAPGVHVMAAETTAVQVQEVNQQGSAVAADAAQASTTAADSAAVTGSGLDLAVGSAILTTDNFAEVCDSNYALYTQSKSAGEEEVAKEAEEKAAAEAAAKAAAEAATAAKAQQVAAAKAAQQTAASTSSYSGSYSGKKLNRTVGSVIGPTGKEVYYNMNMSTVVSVLKRKGYSGNYWVRSDGVKMFGNYVMVAANYKIHPYGSIVQTTLGSAIVCDTGSFIYSYPTALDVAVSW